MAAQSRILQALTETQQMLAKLEGRYDRRPAHLRTDDDRALIEFYRGHAAKLTAMLEAPEKIVNGHEIPLTTGPAT